MNNSLWKKILWNRTVENETEKERKLTQWCVHELLTVGNGDKPHQGFLSSYAECDSYLTWGQNRETYSLTLAPHQPLTPSSLVVQAHSQMGFSKWAILTGQCLQSTRNGIAGKGEEMFSGYSYVKQSQNIEKKSKWFWVRGCEIYPLFKGNLFPLLTIWSSQGTREVNLILPHYFSQYYVVSLASPRGDWPTCWHVWESACFFEVL